MQGRERMQQELCLQWSSKGSMSEVLQAWTFMLQRYYSTAAPCQLLQLRRARSLWRWGMWGKPWNSWSTFVVSLSTSCSDSTAKLCKQSFLEADHGWNECSKCYSISGSENWLCPCKNLSLTAGSSSKRASCMQSAILQWFIPWTCITQWDYTICCYGMVQCDLERTYLATKERNEASNLRGLDSIRSNRSEHSQGRSGRYRPASQHQEFPQRYQEHQEVPKRTSYEAYPQAVPSTAFWQHDNRRWVPSQICLPGWL